MKQKLLNSKDEEIQVFETLYASPSYYADEFSQANHEKLISNIRNDFPLMLGTSWDTNLTEALEKNNELANTIVALRTQISGCDGYIKDLEEELKQQKMRVDSLLNDLVKNDGVVDLNNHFILAEIIKAKVSCGHWLNEDEIKFIKDRI